MAVAILGTFDVANYGDLLFPLIARKRLGRTGGKLLPVSPVGGTPMEDAMESVGIDKFWRSRAALRGILLGGGNIIHSWPASGPYAALSPPRVLVYPTLWAGGSLKARAAGVPLLWNAPGVPKLPAPTAGRILRAVCERSDYVCTRDEESRRLLAATGFDGDVSVVPDTAHEVASLWTADELDAAFRDLMARDAGSVLDRHVVLHSSPHRTVESPDDLARSFDTTAACLDAVPVLLSIGPCHGDATLLAEVAGAMANPRAIVARPRRLVEVAACIARSVAYVGSSMHGAITAAAFGVPFLIVASGADHKMSELTSQLRCGRRFHERWAGAVSSLDLLEQDHGAAIRTASERLVGTLDAHWDGIRRALGAQRRTRTSHHDRRATRSSSRRASLEESHPEVFAPLMHEMLEGSVEVQHRLQRDATTNRAALRDLRAKAGELTRSLDRSRAELADAGHELADASHELEDVRDERGRLQARVSALEATDARREERYSKDLARLLDAIASMHALLGASQSRLPGELEKLVSSLAEVRDSVEHRGNENKRILTGLDQGMQQIKRLQSLEDQLATTRQELGTARAELEAARAHLSRTSEALEGERVARHHETLAWQRRTVSLQSRIARLDARVATAATAITALRRMRDRLDGALHEAGGRRRELEAEVRRGSLGLRDALDTIERTRRSEERKDREAKSLGASLGAAERTAKELRDRLEVRAHHLDESEKRVARLESDLAEQVGNMDGLHVEISRLHRRADRLAHWMDRLDRGTSALLGSRRWKLGTALGNAWQSLQLKQRGSDVPAFLEATLKPYRKWLESSDGREAARADTVPSEAHPGRSAGPNGQPSVDIMVVVPIFNAFDEVRSCIESLLEETTQPHRLLLLDDASTDARIWPLLEDAAARHEHISALRNERNLGYTATINLGCRRATGDVVLLNSDTQVTPGWLANLSAVAHSRPNIATVTPISNAAGAFSVPVPNVVNELPEDMTPREMGSLVSRVSPRSYPRTPTANGFCMYITRTALAAVGEFDERHFPRGYGEENDFCMRASAEGFIHLVDDATFVFHHRSASFGESKKAIYARSRPMLDELHPGYTRVIRDWLSSDPLGEVRRRVSKALAGEPDGTVADDGGPAVLYVVHAGKGGVHWTSRDLMREMSRNRRCVLLAMGKTEWSVTVSPNTGQHETEVHALPEPWRIDAPLDDARASILRDVCRRHEVNLAHVRHFLAGAPEIVHVLKEVGAHVILSFHDYYAVCPTIQLIDENGSFCGGTCTPTKGSCPVARNWLGDGLQLKHAYVNEWKARVAHALRACDGFVTTSTVVKDALVENYPFLNGMRWRIIEHGRDLQGYEDCSAEPTGLPVRVACFGALNRAKGTQVLERLCEINRARGGPFEIHLLGNTERAFRGEEYGAHLHGDYPRHDLPQLLAELRPSVSLIPSQWTETYSHTLTESWAAGLPVIASDIGVLRERVRRHGGGWLADPRSAPAWFEMLERHVLDLDEYRSKREEIRTIAFPSCREMADRYTEFYVEILATNRTDSPQPGHAPAR